ncbi:MAG: hypothetical protein J6M35_07000 [Clostridia bacterium]|nr:hypothetical protein [Clostridia bacterium]
MKKILSILLVAVMMLSVLSLTVAADTLTYSVAKDADGNSLNVKVVNGVEWVEENGKIKMPAGPISSFVLFDNKLATKRVEATIHPNDLHGSGDDRNGIVFALTDYDNDSTFNMDGTDVSYYWAFISGWEGRICVLKMGKHNGWTLLSAGGDWSKSGTPLKDLGIENPADGVKLAAEWDNEGHIKVFVNGKLVEDITDTTGTPLTGDLYGMLVRKWGNTPEGTAFPYDAPVSSFIAGVKSKTETGDATVIVSLIALVAAMGTGIVIGKKRHFN